MTPEERIARIDELFCQAIEQPPPNRVAYLDSACADDDPTVRAEVERLLNIDNELAEHSFMRQDWLRLGRLADDPLGNAAVDTDRPSSASTGDGKLHCPYCRSVLRCSDSGSTQHLICSSCEGVVQLENRRPVFAVGKDYRLGKFVLLEQLGTGGFGTVWRGRDEELDRTVAIKIPHASRLTTDESWERFFREGKNAARLRHPGIVAVYEVGRTEEFPYLVCEYVEGATLDERLKQHPSPTFRETAQLVAEVADALDYAHSVGVIHRDIKPSNIMLGEESSRPSNSSDEKSGNAGNPARYAGPAAADSIGRPMVTDFGLALRTDRATTMTFDGQILGTPSYMSPEQASGASHRVDRRSDVYSLGVVLYQMLSEQLPFSGNPRMLFDQIQREEPRSPRKINDTIPRDLETICLKAMAKEPTRRYESAGALADDLGRWQRGEAVHARPVGVVHRLWRWSNRNPTAAALWLLILFVGVAGGLAAVRQTALARRASRAADRERDARNVAEQREEEAQSARQREATARKDEAHARRLSEQVVQSMVAAFRSPADRSRDGRTITVAEVLERAVGLANEDLVDQPLVRSVFLNAVADAYEGLGLPHAALAAYQTAHRLAEEHLDPDSEGLITVRHNLAKAYFGVGRFDEAAKLQEQTLPQAEDALGPTHPTTILAYSTLANVYHRLGRYEEALELVEVATERLQSKYGDGHPDVWRCLGERAQLNLALGNLDEAAGSLEFLLEKMRPVLGDDHVEVSANVMRLAETHFRSGRFAQAEPLCRTALAGFRRRVGDEHPYTLTCIELLAHVLNEQDQHDEATVFFEELVNGRIATLGRQHDATLISMLALALTHEAAGRMDEGLAVREDRNAALLDNYGDSDARYLLDTAVLTRSYASRGRSEQADAALQIVDKGLANLATRPGTDPSAMLRLLNAAGDAHRTAGHLERAIALFESAVALLNDIEASEPSIAPLIQTNLAQTYGQAGRIDDAIALFEKLGNPQQAAYWKQQR